ncbi:hypothetical protein JB92DRAFT_2833184 [Gautieria morchelliformis]|nr:hypothetical protein JB92DRAFT_2833184 [Gautieria morchelliformis]
MALSQSSTLAHHPRMVSASLEWIYRLQDPFMTAGTIGFWYDVDWLTIVTPFDEVWECEFYRLGLIICIIVAARSLAIVATRTIATVTAGSLTAVTSRPIATVAAGSLAAVTAGAVILILITTQSVHLVFKYQLGCAAMEVVEGRVLEGSGGSELVSMVVSGVAAERIY